MKHRLFIILFALIIFSCNTSSSIENTSEKPTLGLIGEKVMVVSAHPIASEVGKEILANGGNAVDAAVAVQFALAVVYPTAGNIGGGGFMVYRDKNGNSNTLDYREKAPAKASRDMYLDSANNVIEDLSTLGHLAVGVPGAVDGMVKAHAEYGSLSWEQLLQPAIDLATKGFLVTKKEADRFNKYVDVFESVNTVAPSHILNNWNESDTIYHLELASTLVRIRDNGRSGFYEGETASLLLDEMERGNGILTQEDLDNYQSKWRDPIVSIYRDHKIITMSPPSSGGIALTQLLHSVEPYKLKEMGHNSTEYIHLLAEAERRVYADRAEYLGDMDFYDVPIAKLTNREYNTDRMKSFNPLKATPSDSIGSGTILLESDQTTHFSIVDAKGNAVSITTTLNGHYGSKVMVGNAGFFLNNEMDDFSIKPGTHNMFGLVGGEANAIVPGKRMLSSMTPTIVEKNNELYMVVGSPGGSTIITSVFQTILNVIDFNMTMQEAVYAKRVHNQWLPDAIKHEEDGLSEQVASDLVKLGHKLLETETIGRVDAVKVLDNGNLEGGADKRGDDSAAGY